MNPSDHECKYCGSPATQFQFAEFICDAEECMTKAREERGGPGGHLLVKKDHDTGAFGAMDFDQELD